MLEPRRRKWPASPPLVVSLGCANFWHHLDGWSSCHWHRDEKTSCGGCIPVSKWVQVVNSYSIWNWVSFSYLCLYYIYIIIHILRLYFHIFSPWETIPQRWGSFTIGCLRGCTACRCGGLATRGFQPRYVHPTLHFRGVLFPYICQTLGFFLNFWGHFSTCEGATPIISPWSATKPSSIVVGHRPDSPSRCLCQDLRLQRHQLERSGEGRVSTRFDSSLVELLVI